jgi:hypothetical protein
VIEAPQVVERGLLDDATLDELGERQHPHERPDWVCVSLGALRTQRTARSDQHCRSKLERPAQEATASTGLVVDDELVGRQRIPQRDVAEEVALADQLDALALVVIGVVGSCRARWHRPASVSARPADPG